MDDYTEASRVLNAEIDREVAELMNAGLERRLAIVKAVEVVLQRRRALRLARRHAAARAEQDV
jgi:hypothetical protein